MPLPRNHGEIVPIRKSGESRERDATEQTASAERPFDLKTLRSSGTFGPPLESEPLHAK
jgi:hypothetical protein